MLAASDIQQIFTQARTIAVVGLSPRPQRPSHQIARFMQEQGYRVIPVNPGHPQILGEPSYPSLASIPERVDMAVIFRRPEHVLAIVEQIIQLGIPRVWMQPGAENPTAAERALKAGIQVVMGRCWAVEYRLNSSINKEPSS